MKLLWWRARHVELDARVARAKRHARDAEEEAERSRLRYEAMHETVVMPLRKAASRNQFAELLQQSLADGHGRST